METRESVRPPVPATSRPPTRRAVAIGVFVLLAAALVVALFVASRSFGPIEGGGGLLSPRPVGDVDYRHVESIQPGGKSAYAVDARRPGAFGLSFEIENAGRLPLTFEGVTDDHAFILQQDVRISSVSVAPNPHAGDEIPIGGVTLEPGERRRLHVTFSWTAACADEGAGGSFLSPAGAEVRYSGLFVVGRTQTVEMPSDVVFVCGMDLRRLGDWIVQPPRGTRRVAACRLRQARASSRQCRSAPELELVRPP